MYTFDFYGTLKKNEFDILANNANNIIKLFR